MRVTVIGAGVAGLTCALELAERGAQVELLERSAEIGPGSCSWCAGGMLAPWCELEHSPRRIAELGEEALGWWRTHHPATVSRGSLVVAHGRDAGELAHFARRTERLTWLDGERIAALEPDLAGRFEKALLFAEEAHLDPRAALAGLAAQLRARGVALLVNRATQVAPKPNTVVVDCTGLAARQSLGTLRGVKGEMLIVRLPELSLSRPVRVLHPRVPVYVVPRGDGRFMIGATMIESDAPTRVSARSLLELLGAAYALHPAFAEAEVIEINTGVRPAFPDNLPRIVHSGGVWHVNGLYRHGFLVAPALATRLADALLQAKACKEVVNEDHRERLLA